MGIFEAPDEYVFADEIKEGDKVAIFHGTVNTSVADLGHTFMDADVDVDLFDGFDMVLLGDIHRTQRLQEYDTDKPEIWYAGSLIQQNHGESLEKGFLTWNVDTKKPEFIKIENDYGYFTIDIKDGEPSDTDKIPNKPRLRIRTENTERSEVKRILADIRKKVDVQEVTINRMDTTVGLLGTQTSASIGDIRDVDYQNLLIEAFLDKKYALDSETVERVKAINVELNAKLPPDEMIPNTIWELKGFEFSNMFSYGEGNYVDFSKMHGTYGIFAPNAEGKSAILDSLSFCLFDKSSRAFKASEIVNSRKEDFKCKADFAINDVSFHVERKASKRKYTEQTRVDVNFWYEDDVGDKYSLNGEDRRDTNDVIRNHIGSFDDYILTALSEQNASAGFIDKGQTDRKELLSRFLGLNVLEELYQLASNEISEVEVLLKEFSRQDFTQQLATAENTLVEEKKDYSARNKKRRALIKKRNALRDKIIERAKKIIPLDDSITDLTSLLDDKTRLEKEIERTKIELEKLSEDTIENKKRYTNVLNALSTLDEEVIGAEFLELVRLGVEKEKLANQFEQLKIDIGHKLSKLKKLQKHEYDPNCKFCMNNVFVKDAIRTKEELDHDKQLLSDVVSKQESISNMILAVLGSRELHDRMIKLNEERDEIKVKQLQINTAVSYANSELSGRTSELKVTTENIARYYEMEDAVKTNNTIEAELKSLELENTEFTSQIDTLDNELRNIHANVEVAKTTIKTITETIAHAKYLEEQYSAYEYYLDSVKRNGIPYELISTVIPELEIEVNNILNQIVDYSLVWELDGKNINVHIAYDEDNVWPLDLTSGMERFISNVAIRTALLSVSSLPRPNYLAIDEGFGVLDSDNINSVYLLMDYLKIKFDFILIITHLDSMKDVVDSVVEVKKDSDGYSVVQF